MEIYLVRHTSVDVAPGICYGRSDVNVRNSFEEEAHKTKLQLKDIQFDKVFTSPLTRAIKLASYCGYSKAEIDYRLLFFKRNCHSVTSTSIASSSELPCSSASRSAIFAGSVSISSPAFIASASLSSMSMLMDLASLLRTVFLAISV